MANITLMGTNYPNVPSVILPQTGGGTAQFYEYGDLSWMGQNAVQLNDTPYSLSKTLADTSYASSFIPSETPTTAMDIYASQTIGTFTAHPNDYDYILRWHWDIQVKLNDGATYVYLPERNYGSFFYVIHKRPYGLANFASETPSYNYCTALYTASQYYIYYGSSGAETWTTTMYGIYASGVASTFSSTSSASPTVTIKTPKIQAKCNKSYFASARRGDIADTTTIKIKGDLFQVDAGTSPLRKMYMDAIHLYSNPL